MNVSATYRDDSVQIVNMNGNDHSIYVSYINSNDDLIIRRETFNVSGSITDNVLLATSATVI